MFQLDEFRDCLERLARALETCGIRYYITGGAAFIAYGDPRTTQDIDLVVDPASIAAELSPLLSQLKESHFLLNEATVREAVRSRRQFQLIDMISALKMDLYPRELVPGAIDRAIEVEILPGARFPIASRPDLVVSKLFWISKGSHKSRRDVRQLLLTASDPERQSVCLLAEELSLSKLLDEVLSEADEIDL